MTENENNHEIKQWEESRTGWGHHASP